MAKHTEKEASQLTSFSTYTEYIKKEAPNKCMNKQEEANQFTS